MDAWGWLAAGYRRDGHHRAVKRLLDRLSASGVPKVTTDYVLDEIITRLFRKETPEEAAAFVAGLFRAVERDHLRLVRITPDRFARAWALRQRYIDKPRISFTDLTSMAIMDELELRRVVTDDDHFRWVGYEPVTPT